MNGYVGYYQGFKYEAVAATNGGAKQQIVAMIKAKGQYVSKSPRVMLTEKPVGVPFVSDF